MTPAGQRRGRVRTGPSVPSWASGAELLPSPGRERLGGEGPVDVLAGVCVCMRACVSQSFPTEVELLG